MITSRPCSTTVPQAIVTADHQIAEAFQARHELITDYYDARLKTGGKGGMSGAADYKPVPPERLYLKPSEWDRLLEGHAVAQFTTFDAAPDRAEHDRSPRPPPRRLRPGAHGAGRQPVRQGGRARARPPTPPAAGS